MTAILELAQKMRRSEAPSLPIGRLLGLALKAIEPGRAIFEMEADGRHHNPMGTLHGGVYCDLADAAMGYAYATTLEEGSVLRLGPQVARAWRNNFEEPLYFLCLQYRAESVIEGGTADGQKVEGKPAWPN